jgi:hypothetical protein
MGWIRDIVDKITGKKKEAPVELLEVFGDYTIEVEYREKSGKYRILYEIVPKKQPTKITEEALKSYVERLASKYPEEGFTLTKVRLGKTTYYVMTKVGERAKFSNVPIYFDIENQKIFVPKECVDNNEKLTNYILMRTLGALGVTQSKYLGRERIESK